jgi:hypothetical protein
MSAIFIAGISSIKDLPSLIMDFPSLIMGLTTGSARMR